MQQQYTITKAAYDELQGYADSGSFIEYYTKLESLGDRYATLALGVAQADRFEGNLARQFAQNAASWTAGHEVAVTTDDWLKISRELVSADWQARKGVNTEPTDGSSAVWQELRWQTIRDFHVSVFQDKGLPGDAWTGRIPLEAEPANADQLWDRLISGALGPRLFTELLMGLEQAAPLVDTSVPEIAYLLSTRQFGKLASVLLLDIATDLVNPTDATARPVLWLRAMIAAPQRIWNHDLTPEGVQDAVMNGAFFNALGGGPALTLGSIDRGDGGRIIAGTRGADVIGKEGKHGATDKGDMIIAYDGDDTIYTKAGDDEAYGLSGNDTFIADEGVDIYDGGEGNDWVVALGGKGAILYGGAGQDFLYNSSWKGQLYGGDGVAENDGAADVFWWSAGSFVMDAGEKDILEFFGLPLTGGYDVQTKGEEWAYDWVLPFIRYGLTDSKQLIVQSWIGNIVDHVLRNSPNDDILLSSMIVEDYDQGEGGNWAHFMPGDLGMTFRIMRPGEQTSGLIALAAFYGFLSNYADAVGRFGKELRWIPGNDPLILDLNGDGITTTSLTQSGVHFDFNGDHFAERSGADGGGSRHEKENAHRSTHAELSCDRWHLDRQVELRRRVPVERKTPDGSGEDGTGV